MMPCFLLALLTVQEPVPNPLPAFEELRRMVPRRIPGVQLASFDDVDGDGDPDLVASGTYSFELLLNDGHALFEPLERSPFAALPATVRGDLVFTRLDGDELPDALLGGTPYLRTGNAFVAGVSPFPAPLPFEQRWTGLADVDGDGDEDVVLVQQSATSSWTVRSAENLGDGTLAETLAQALTLVPSPYGKTPLLADLDGDRDLDLVLVDPMLVQVFRNDGSAFSAWPGAFSPPLVDGADGAFGDLDGDGDLDAAFVRTPFPAAELAFYANAGDGTFTMQTSLPLTPASARVVLLDADGDGDEDVFLPAALASESYYRNGGAFQFTNASATLPGGTAVFGDALAADCDQDGDEDLLLVDYAHGNRLLLADGRGALVDAAPHVPGATSSSRPGQLADLDGDGDLDRIAGTPLLWTNDGSALFTDRTATLPVALPAHSLATGDVDGDGDLDVLWNPETDPQTRLFLNDGHALFADATQGRLPVESELSQAVALADVDGDGDPDALLGNYSLPQSSLPAPNALWTNDGHGSFTVAPGALPRADYTTAVGVADVDGDGDLDVLFGNQGEEALLVNDGAGSFADATSQLPAVSGGLANDVAFGDLDADGDADAYVAEQGFLSGGPCYDCGLPGAPDQVLLNDGAGTFALAPWFESDVSSSVELVDADGDGDLDAVVRQSLFRRLNPPDPWIQLFRNDGSGLLAADPVPIVQDRTVGPDLAAGDVDGDRDADLVFGDRVFTSIQRSLSWRALPRVGGLLEFALRGRAGEPWLLLASSRTAQVPLEPHGVLRLAPETIVRIASGRIGAAGTASFRAEVPSDPILIGQTLYWQALVGARFTNLEPTTFSGVSR